MLLPHTEPGLMSTELAEELAKWNSTFVPQHIRPVIQKWQQLDRHPLRQEQNFQTVMTFISNYTTVMTNVTLTNSESDSENSNSSLSTSDSESDPSPPSWLDLTGSLSLHNFTVSKLQLNQSHAIRTLNSLGYWYALAGMDPMLIQHWSQQEDSELAEIIEKVHRQHPPKQWVDAMFDTESHDVAALHLPPPLLLQSQPLPYCSSEYLHIRSLMPDLERLVVDATKDGTRTRLDFNQLTPFWYLTPQTIETNIPITDQEMNTVKHSSSTTTTSESPSAAAAASAAAASAAAATSSTPTSTSSAASDLDSESEDILLRRGGSYPQFGYLECDLGTQSPTGLLDCLLGKKIQFIGDSMQRYLFLSFIWQLHFGQPIYPWLHGIDGPSMVDELEFPSTDPFSGEAVGDGHTNRWKNYFYLLYAFDGAVSLPDISNAFGKEWVKAGHILYLHPVLDIEVSFIFEGRFTTFDHLLERVELNAPLKQPNSASRERQSSHPSIDR